VPLRLSGGFHKSKAVADVGRRALAAGFEKARRLHAELCAQSVRGDALKGRILEEIRARINPSTGVAGIGRLTSMANTFRCRPEMLRRYIRELAQSGLIIKNDGNAASMFSTLGGITIALALPESVWNALNPQQSTATPYPPISDTTGIGTPPSGTSLTA
jgi:predicted transcriptional regulator